MRARATGRTAVGSAVAAAILAVATALAPVLLPGAATAATGADAFFTYSGSKPLSDYPPGSVLKTRTIPYSLAGIPTPLAVRQIVFRSTDQRGRAVAAVTSVIKPLGGSTAKVISYQSFYDSLNPEDGPSRAIAGGTNPGGLAAHFETAMMASFLLQGFALVIPDTEGPTADFAAGPEYGRVTLDSLRAAFRATGTGIAPGARAGLIGYSGGAIATNWASVLAPSYAPGINRRLVGAAEGGVLVRPSANLPYVDGSLVWAGVAPMAIVGVSRAFGIDLQPYLSDYGKQVHTRMQKASITQVLGAYPGLTWKKLVKPAYADPASIPIFVSTVNKLNLGVRPNPTVPMFIGQGTRGELEGTSGSKPGLGAGDGVMIAGDVRTLARKYCAAGVRVVHREYALSHFTSVALWLPQATTWLTARFGTTPAPTNCSTIKAGNPLTPLKAV
ncbi:lipase family protein [Nocardioides sp.]|uniref:lipase family protein n=1 Tax=Nocardioides sp. TaxID=35761 RepID=UPI002CCFFA22|nr:lipase family protein [Nocardioides sp.]HSX68724.1 lipase family protein [Nocardioides sp.]